MPNRLLNGKSKRTTTWFGYADYILPIWEGGEKKFHRFLPRLIKKFACLPLTFFPLTTSISSFPCQSTNYAFYD